MNLESAEELLTRERERLLRGHYDDDSVVPGACASCDRAYKIRLELEELEALAGPPAPRYTTPAADALAIGAGLLAGERDRNE